MSSEKKLSLGAAILINVNIMMGAGIFINTVPLARIAGLIGCTAYAIVGLLMLPLIGSIAQLVQLYPEGGFFTYAKKELGTWAGFASAWIYFVGKLGSATLFIHTAVSLARQIIPLLHSFNIFALDALVLCLFLFLNTFNLQTGRAIQGWLMAFKLTPIIFIILLGLFAWDSSALDHPIAYTALSDILPFALYAFLGFEATCSLSGKIENSKVNGPRAIFISYALVIGLYVLYQLFFYLLLGDQLGTQESFMGAFPALLQKVFGRPLPVVHSVLNLCIAASALGGSYGILYSNGWNLYTLAQKNMFAGSRMFTRLNTNGIATACVIAQGCICALYLWITSGSALPLQLTSTLGSIAAYTLSVVSLFAAWRRGATLLIPGWAIGIALVNCCVLIAACMKTATNLPQGSLAGFVIMLSLGLITGPVVALFNKNK